MQLRVKVHPLLRGHLLQQRRRLILPVVEVGAGVNVPGGIAVANRFQPTTNAGLAGVDLLSAANEADNYGPVRMAVHAGNEEFGL